MLLQGGGGGNSLRPYKESPFSKCTVIGNSHKLKDLWLKQDPALDLDSLRCAITVRLC